MQEAGRRVSDRNRTDRRTGPAHGSNPTPARSARFAGCSVLVPASFSRSPALRASTSSSPAGPTPNCIGAGRHGAAGAAPGPGRAPAGGPRRTARPAIIVSAMRRFAPRWGWQAAWAGVLALASARGAVPFCRPGARRRPLRAHRRQHHAWSRAGRLPAERPALVRRLRAPLFRVAAARRGRTRHVGGGPRLPRRRASPRCENV